MTDPVEQTVTMLGLDAGIGRYSEHGVFARGAIATSPTLPGFSMSVEELFACQT